MLPPGQGAVGGERVALPGTPAIDSDADLFNAIIKVNEEGTADPGKDPRALCQDGERAAEAKHPLW